MDVHTRIAGERRLPAPSGKNPRDYTLLAARAFRELVEESGVDEGKIIGCGVSTPGPVNAQTGEIFHPPNLPWGVVPFKDLMEEALKMPVKVEKDANLSALGERWRGAGRDVENLIYVLVGEGIGGGIVIGGTLYQGNPFGAGEIGHVTVDIDGFAATAAGQLRVSGGDGVRIGRRPKGGAGAPPGGGEQRLSGGRGVDHASRGVEGPSGRG